MQLGIEAAAAGKHERSQAGERCIRLINLLLEPLHLARRYARLFRVHVFGQCGQRRTKIKKFVLHPPEYSGEGSQRRHFRRQFLGRSSRQPGKRIQLVHHAEALDAGVVFRNALPAHEARFAGIARSRVNPVQRDARLVENLLAHSVLLIVFPAAFYNLDSVDMSIPIRVLVAKPGLDGHDRGAKVIARALRDAGMEVIYTGLRQTPEMIVNAALEEDVQVIGLSILSGAHNVIVPRVMELLREKEMTDVLVVAGGIIPDEDARELKKLGVAEVFQPGASLQKIVDFIRDSVKQVA
jgi:methylmalonyl-CoA mutase C-terminal domain/subunit